MERRSLRSGLVSPELHVSCRCRFGWRGFTPIQIGGVPHRLSSDKMRCVFLALKNECLYRTQ